MIISAVVPPGGGGFTPAISVPPLGPGPTMKSADVYDPDNVNEAIVTPLEVSKPEELPALNTTWLPPRSG